MLIPVVKSLVKVLVVSVPTITAVKHFYALKLQRLFKKLSDECIFGGQWNLGRAYGEIDRLRGNLWTGRLTEEDRNILRTWVGADSARRTLAQNRADENLDPEEEDAFENEGDEGEEGDEPPVRRIRRGGHRSAARIVCDRVVASIGQRAFSSAQKMIVEDHARRELASLNVRKRDIVRLLDTVVGMYFTPTESQLRLGALLKAKEFAAQRRLVDLEK
ncbi:hypothetical protein 1 [Changjiang tombus-like virus 10]|uniref:hypothetical protein 1 n=1 Tax=Changjiang tombus-like virus 10 TaxID=1922803 RepID=UPI00090A291C|nr:hypothetical protein 1 [Changjiang tombus-like virus 10]APG76224.1 hypothetical protein 1 [Changjiang tombus-like virus 10]